MWMDSSASNTWRAVRSASEWTLTARMPRRRRVRITRSAISPRLATRTVLNTAWLSARVPHQQLDGGGVVAVAGVIELRAVGNQDPHIHVRLHLHVATRPGDAVL